MFDTKEEIIFAVKKIIENGPDESFYAEAEKTLEMHRVEKFQEKLVEYVKKVTNK